MTGRGTRQRGSRVRLEQHLDDPRPFGCLLGTGSVHVVTDETAPLSFFHVLRSLGHTLIYIVAAESTGGERQRSVVLGKPRTPTLRDSKSKPRTGRLSLAAATLGPKERQTETASVIPGSMCGRKASATRLSKLPSTSKRSGTTERWMCSLGRVYGSSGGHPLFHKVPMFNSSTKPGNFSPSRSSFCVFSSWSRGSEATTYWTTCIRNLADSAAYLPMYQQPWSLGCRPNFPSLPPSRPPSTTFVLADADGTVGPQYLGGKFFPSLTLYPHPPRPWFAPAKSVVPSPQPICPPSGAGSAKGWPSTCTRG